MVRAAGKRRVAVLGGGVGAITAAYALTDSTAARERYNVTVYQMGWRLGGKGASGRNAGAGQRIEEHGLHVWAGFYENAFRVMRDCYEELATRGLRKPEAPLARWDQAFKPLNRFYISENVGDDWRPWLIDFAATEELPGEGDPLLPTPLELLGLTVEWLRGQLEILEDRLGHPVHGHDDDEDGPIRDLLGDAALISVLQAGSFARFALNVAGELARRGQPAGPLRTVAARLLRRLASELSEQVFEQIRPRLEAEDDLRRAYIMVNLGTAAVRGMIADDVIRDGFDVIDHVECSAWLRLHGASSYAVDSPLFRGCYDYVFGFPAGDFNRRGMGAGTAIRGLLRMAWTYKGALFYKMQAGMGDVVFAPFYQVLKDRGVRFEFFQRVTDLHLSADKKRIERIGLCRQAVPKGDEYDPLVDVNGLPCWPSEPVYERLVDGEALRGLDLEAPWEPVGTLHELRDGADFDEVVLGISIGSLPELTMELAAASPPWQRMLDKVQTVQTHALQLWLTQSPADLGWPAQVVRYNPQANGGPYGEPVVTSFDEPFDTWADMAHLLPHEAWPEPAPRSIAYFCSPRPDEAAPVRDGTAAAAALGSGRAAAKAWVENELPRLWPGLRGPNGFRWDLLHDPQNRSGAERMAAQYVRVNVAPSERYVLSVEGSLAHRLQAGQSGFANLYLAGDWTRNGINAGCVEAAVMSGLQAARALSKLPFEVVGEGDVLENTAPRPPGLDGLAASAAPFPFSAAYAMGQLDGWFTFLPLPEAAVASLLPRGLRLARQHLTPRGTHPVTVLFAKQMGVRPSFLPQPPKMLDYHELIVAIGFVEHADRSKGGGVFCWLPCLYLDRLIHILTGRVFYGLPKHRAAITRTDERFKAVLGTSMLVDATFDADGQVGSAADFPTLRGARELLAQPMAAKSLLGQWQYSFFDFGLERATVQPCRAEVTVGAGLGLPAGRYAQPSLARHKLGTFRLWTEWTLTNPLDSARIASTAAAHASFDAKPRPGPRHM
ncbi:MAG TPA: NAD(P)-binding protein [Geminicoccus sp.]|uniref:NAD(P)-binding protein n=1 Tax=Geminicoccus sp. TaxID=2024832 RepID=UPI002E369B68|nr:NAD(P)-binding protein [Geminicoccus sp.]HEX2525184.1 NAD(P)-binding protein [Geminicoccus sp.]